MNLPTKITIEPVIGGFIVTYPKYHNDILHHVQEVCTSSGKAMKVAKAAVETFSLVTKAKSEADEV
jgi:hypothetical protein